MRLSNFRVAALACVAGSLVSCLDSTQVTFVITTDVPCANIGGTSVTVGIAGQVEKAAPVKVTKSCTPDGKVLAIGTYAVKPKSTTTTGTAVIASVKVAMAVGSDLSVETECTPAKSYANCIVARRRLSFVTHRSLTVPVEMLLICTGVECDENSTCTRAGKCSTSFIDSTKCEDDICKEPEPLPSEGLPCFNEGAANQLFCKGVNAWCTRSSSGMRACSPAPVPGGVSFQCRTAEDCGPNLQCVMGTNGVLGQCVVNATITDVPLCQLSDTVSPCPGGPRDCDTDAGFGLLICHNTDAGTRADHDGGLPCPRTGDLYCDIPTPYCSISSGNPRCVNDGGAQCWYPSDCPAGKSCYAGIEGHFFNLCDDGPSARNPIQLCNEKLDGGDCPPGKTCDGMFYGLRACRGPNGLFDGGRELPCPPTGGDGGLRCSNESPTCERVIDGGYQCTAAPDPLQPSWECRNSGDCPEGKRCVATRSPLGPETVCAFVTPDAGQPVVCQGSSGDCRAGSTCGLSSTLAGGLSICTPQGATCDTSNDFYSLNTCSSRAVCCNGINPGRGCFGTIDECVISDAGQPYPIQCVSSAQCNANELCLRFNPGATPNGGILCTVPDAGVTVRDIHCQPETVAHDCIPARPYCAPAFNGNYHCVSEDGGFGVYVF